MAKFITFGTINRSLLYIVLTSISLVINQYIYGFTYIECFYQMNIYRTFYELITGDVIKDDSEINKKRNKIKFLRHRVFDPLFSYIGVIILSYIFIKNKKPADFNNTSIQNETSTQNKSEIRLIYNKSKVYFYHFKGILFYILILFLWVAEENLILIYVDIFQDLDFWFFELIFVSVIFSKIFIFKISSHQILGVAISVLVGSILKIYNITITFISDSEKDEKERTYYVQNPRVVVFAVLYFLLIILRSYVNTKIKTFLDLKYISHRFLMITYGIAGTFICFITGIITTNATCPDDLDNVCSFMDNNKLYYDNWYVYYGSGKNMAVRLIIIVFGLITYFVNKYYLTLTIKNYTPIHVIFSFPIQFFIEKTFLLIYTAIFHRDKLFGERTDVKKLKKFLLDESGDIGSIIGFLIYLEIIELNFCGLNFNLKKNIIKRSESDYIESLASKMIPLKDAFDDDSDDEDDSSNENNNDNKDDTSQDNNNKDYNSSDNNSNINSEKNAINDA